MPTDIDVMLRELGNEARITGHETLVTLRRRPDRQGAAAGLQALPR